MTQLFEPFTPEAFKQQTKLDAEQNEAIYIRWVNTHINYANYKVLREMVDSLKEIKTIVRDSAGIEDSKFMK